MNFIFRIRRRAEQPDPDTIIDRLCQTIIDAHNDRWHPGYSCAENSDGECLDEHGGVPVDGPLGQRRPLRQP